MFELYTRHGDTRVHVRVRTNAPPMVTHLTSVYFKTREKLMTEADITLTTRLA